ncbi:MAG: hypothetical protein O3A80_04375 [bacterium]|nr:hypothetical protein [bacterium]MDA1292700.1 hypothetical protein [bacterium]
MELDPHTLQKILDRIKQQMRCPQCGKSVLIDFASVRVVSDDAMLLQLKCDSCNAFIVLHASLQGMEQVKAQLKEEAVNASSTLEVSKEELMTLNAALQQSGGSFDKLFEEYGGKSEE